MRSRLEIFATLRAAPAITVVYSMRYLSDKKNTGPLLDAVYNNGVTKMK